MARRVTAKWLRDQGACAEQVVIFEKEWPRGVQVNAGSLHRASKIGLHLEWLARRWLTLGAYKTFSAETADGWHRWMTSDARTTSGRNRAERKFDKSILEPFIRQVEAGRVP